MIGAYLFQACDALALDGPALLRRAHIADEVFTQPEPAISADSYVKFWSALATATNRPDAARIVGALAGASATNKMHLISYGSATIKHYLENLVYYGPLIAVPLSKLTYANGRFEIARMRDDACVAADFHIQVQFVALVESIRFAAGLPVMPKRVMIQATSNAKGHAVPPDSLADLAGYFGVPVELGTESFILFDDDVEGLPIRMQSWLLWSSVRDKLDALLWEELQYMPMHKQVERALEALLPSGKSSLDAVALHLAVSQRTLQRRLQDENTNFRMVLLETRRRLAQYYARMGGLKKSEIAQRLGFQDINSYYRVAQHWRL